MYMSFDVQKGKMYILRQIANEKIETLLLINSIKM